MAPTSSVIEAVAFVDVVVVAAAAVVVVTIVVAFDNGVVAIVRLVVAVVVINDLVAFVVVVVIDTVLPKWQAVAFLQFEIIRNIPNLFDNSVQLKGSLFRLFHLKIVCSSEKHKKCF